MENNANNVSNTYPYDSTTRHKHDEPDYNMQMVYHIKKEENADKSNLIDMEVFKPTIRNTIKRFRI